MRVHTEGLEHFERHYNKPQGFVLSAWHGRIMLFPVAILRIAKPNYPKRTQKHYIMSSKSRHGEMISFASKLLGVEAVRGSATNKSKNKDKGGLRALIQSVRLVKAGSIFAFTPDGPIGPHQQMKEGMLILAQRAGVPIIPYGLAARPIWRFNSWDKFMVPFPFAKCSIVFGEPLWFDKETIEQADIDRMQKAMEFANNRAEEIL